MRIGDVIIATASLFVVYGLLYTVLAVVLVPVSISGMYVATYLSPLLAAIVVGYVFGGKIREGSRIKSIAKIVVLLSVLVSFVYWISYSIGRMGTFIDESLQNMYSTGSWTTMDWVVYETLYATVNTTAVGFLVAVLSIIGLYIGSTLRKPKI